MISHSLGCRDYAAIASIAGSLAAHDLYRYMTKIWVSDFWRTGGLLSAILMAMLMITYHMNSQPLGR